MYLIPPLVIQLDLMNCSMYHFWKCNFRSFINWWLIDETNFFFFVCWTEIQLLNDQSKHMYLCEPIVDLVQTSNFKLFLKTWFFYMNATYQLRSSKLEQTHFIFFRISTSISHARSDYSLVFFEFDYLHSIYKESLLKITLFIGHSSIKTTTKKELFLWTKKSVCGQIHWLVCIIAPRSCGDH